MRDAAGTGGDAPSPLSPPSLLYNRDYRLVWTSQTISEIGTGATTVALPLLILSLTRSPAQAGFVVGLRLLAFAIVSLPAGALVDRWNRKWVMVLCDTGRAFLLGSIPLTFWLGRLLVVQLYLVALLEGVLYTFFSLSQLSSLPLLVPEEQLPTATARFQGALYGAGLLGPPLGGGLYQIGKVFPFLADAVSYAASAGSLFFLTTPLQRKRATTRQQLHIEIMEGLRWIWRQSLIRYLAFMTFGLTFTSGAFEIIMIVLAKRVLHAPPFAIGLIFGIAAAGGVLGSLVADWVHKRFRFPRVIISISWIVTFLWPLYLVAPNPVILGIITAAIYMVAPIYLVTQQTYRLLLTPDELRGRVNSVFRLITLSGVPVGLGLGGTTLQFISPRAAVIVFSACMLAVAISVTLSDQVRNVHPVAEAQSS
jgi:MFS family permease